MLGAIEAVNSMMENHGVVTTIALAVSLGCTFFLWRCVRDRSQIIDRLMDLLQNNTRAIKCLHEDESDE